MVVVQRGGNPAGRGGGMLGTGVSPYTTIGILILLNLLCFQLGRHYEDSVSPSSSATRSTLLSIGEGNTIPDPLRPRAGAAKNLPAIHVDIPPEQDSRNQLNRHIYGGKGDGQHLGGWTEIDIHGLSPWLWRLMMTKFGIKSILDVGCGRGISTTWFILNGMDALCVEGSHDAYEHSVLPDKDKQMVEHDFSRGPYWPAKTYDAVWCVEFLEHVGRNFHKNYLPVFRKAAILFVTHSIWGGWHHVEVHKHEWWIQKFELYGFRYMHDLTLEAREIARQEAMKGPPTVTGERPNPQNLYNLLIFFNPAVGGLPEHAHLFAEPGCFDSSLAKNGTTIKRKIKCGTSQRKEETVLPPEFEPLPLLDENQKRWEDHLKKFIKVANQG